MPSRNIEADYLVVGGGATAMAFVDTLLDETDGEIVMVDRHDHPGGHWNDAYPFVRLHQPSAFYGVCSRDLGTNRKLPSGLNAGYYDLASRDEILDYYDQLMQQRFLPSGRVRWLPMSEIRFGSDGERRVRSLPTGSEADLIVRRKIVNATHARTEVPSTHGPRYGVAEGVEIIPVNALSRIQRAHACYTVVGSGKTGMDACLWLLGKGIEPDRIRWIMPRDAWMIDRAANQPFAENFESTMTRVLDHFGAIRDATSVPHLFELLEDRGVLLRLTRDVEPQAYHCANISSGELKELRRIGDVVRLGRVKSIESGRLVLDQGSVIADPDTLYIDCSSSAVQVPPDVPVFDGSTINLLMVRWCQPLFSAALIAFVEGHFDDDAVKNSLCKPVSSPFVPLDWLTMWQQTLGNLQAWQQRPELLQWLSGCRLDSLHAMQRGMDPSDPRRQAMLERFATEAAEAAAKLPILMSEASNNLTGSLLHERSIVAR